MIIIVIYIISLVFECKNKDLRLFHYTTKVVKTHKNKIYYLVHKANSGTISYKSLVVSHNIILCMDNLSACTMNKIIIKRITKTLNWTDILYMFIHGNS